ncbi:efflux RND transporter periplasmic adaptor subunit [Alishewanella tabrizica]|uniref:MexE family multidrug efflux RND transporter periplasmic adaptor subunit n=1 Tax=Alishewanella tabrizica TaxID=671278 RepID=A0ABQ2WV24_9ALTE|nr:efflux RND transporter periplasmic adaptor subunit [Alishewanella tabrizica]GGW71904.1 MexE family multidrug efflux RND transporter periplasmic adaptor subunit [Alishewanella tabrizica]
MRNSILFLRNSSIFVIALAVLSACSEPSAPAAVVAPTPEVSTYQIQASTVAYTSALPGRTTDFRQAEIRPQVSGILQKRLFTEGQQVAAGDVLYQIDPATYQAALATAEANVSRAQVTLANAKLRHSRLQGLLSTQVVSQQDVDDANAVVMQADADVKAALAQRQTAQINVNYTQIKAPISGQIGRSMVTEGALLTANQAEILATIRQLDPIYVDLTQSGSELLQLRRQFPEAQQHAVAVSLTLDDGSAYAQTGELQFSEASVDPSTGMITLRAVFPNPQGELLPGMFVRASLAQAQQADALLVPQTAVIRTPKGGANVMVVSPDGTVESRPVTLGRIHEQYWVAESGLSAGEQVIVAGLQKVRPGMQVNATPVQE